MARFFRNIQGTNGNSVTFEGYRPGGTVYVKAYDGKWQSTELLRNEARELRDALNEALGEPHVTGAEVDTVARVARDLALEEAAAIVEAARTTVDYGRAADRIRALVAPASSPPSIPPALVTDGRE